MTQPEAVAAIRGIQVMLMQIGALTDLPKGALKHVTNALNELGAATKKVEKRHDKRTIQRTHGR